jgi:GntR family transcriptional regulator, rspAB operon transcriptional repressor
MLVMSAHTTAADLYDSSKAERAYGILRRQIRELALPPGAPLRKEEIALALGVSRAPISEAIARLADEGLVDVFPKHGSFVAPIRAAQVRESLFIRMALETEAMRRVAANPSAGLLQELDQNLVEQAEALDANDLVRFSDLDDSLHEAIFSAVETPRALRLLNAARAPLDRVRRLALPEEGRPLGTLTEHQSLVAAIRSGDSEFAAVAMRTHLSMAERAIAREFPRIEKKYSLS